MPVCRFTLLLRVSPWVILGVEDHLGDMDFKVAGTPDMITALQLDTKIEGLPADVLIAAMNQAHEARLFILETMNACLAAPREELAETAPKIEAVMIPKDKIGEVIGPKGKTIRELEEETGASIDIDDDGTIRVGAPDTTSLNLAKERILAIGFPPEAKVGEVYDGEVVNVTKFGAFVNILPGRDGLLHISKIGGNKRIDRVEDVLNLGDAVKVVVREIDDRGKVSLDMADAPSGDDSDDSGSGDDDRASSKDDSKGSDDRDRDRDRGDRGGDRNRNDRGGDRDNRRGNNRGRDRNRDRDRDRDRDNRSDKQSDDKPGRKVVSFEDDFEAGN